MTGSTLQPDVPVGPASATGYGTAALAFVGMVLAFIFPNGDAQTLGVIAAGVVGLGSLLVTNLGRHKQAIAQIAAAPRLVEAHAYVTSASVSGEDSQPDEPEEPGDDLEPLFAAAQVREQPPMPDEGNGQGT